jgi:hypothetical protein
MLGGMSVGYDKEGTDPCIGDTHYVQHVPVTSFRTGSNDDGGLWAVQTYALAAIAVDRGASGIKIRSERYAIFILGENCV